LGIFKDFLEDFIVYLVYFIYCHCTLIIIQVPGFFNFFQKK
jgi:hypothetical protein